MTFKQQNNLYTTIRIFNVLGLPSPTPEYKFHPVRKWRFDYAFVNEKIAIELNGAVWTQGRHTRGSGALKDWEKINSAQEFGWIVLQYESLKKIDIEQIKRCLQMRKI
jgi:hypothetical protein